MNRKRSGGQGWPSRLLRAMAAIAGLLCIEAGPAEADWTSSGPYEGSVLQTAIALAIDPTTPTTLYAGTSGGAFKSTDGGASWSPINTGLTCGGLTCIVEALALDPQTPTTLYAGAGRSFGCSTCKVGGVFKSTDGGTSWSAPNMGRDNLEVQTLAIDPLTPTTLYAGTFGDGVFKSTDGGGSWSLTALTTADVRALALAPTTPTTLYAGTTGGLSESTDGGMSWGWLTAHDVRALALAPTTPTTLYVGYAIYYGKGLSGGVIWSTDGGTSWRGATTGLACGEVMCAVFALAIDPTTPTTLYVGTFGGGVFKSTDGGTSWRPMNTGMHCADYFCGGGTCGSLVGTCTARALALDPTTPTILYAATYNGVFKWTCCTLTVGRAGTGEGTVTSNPPGIGCGSDCAVQYAAGTAVALTATPSAGSSFSAWSGACTGSGACVVSMEEDWSVSATFILAAPSSGDGDGSGCVIATAAYGSPLAPEVARLRQFRDRYLLPHRIGQAVVGLYARLSPGMANTVARSAAARAVVRVALLPLSWWAGLMLAAPVAGTAVLLCALALSTWLGLGLTRTVRRSLRR